MDEDLTPDQRAFLAEVREFLTTHVTPALRAELAEYDLEFPGGEVSAFRAAVGRRGWFGINWPTDYGGLGLSPVHQHLLVNEFEYWGVPGPDLTVTSVAPMIMRHGTEQNRREFLPPIARGEMTCAVGYSEPHAGTDLAALSTRAVRDGDHWVINGAKIWNSMAQRVSHEWLCVRTDPDAPKHKGISVIIVPIDSPGIEIRPIITWGDYRTNETFFTDVRVPVANLIGEENRGWEYITGALDLERGALTNAGDLRRSVDDLIRAIRSPRLDGTRPADDPWVRAAVAELDAEVATARLMGLEAAGLLADGTIPTVEVSAEKIFTSELRQRIADVAMRALGPAGLLAYRSEIAPAGGRFERLYRAAPLLRFGGGHQ